MTIKRDWVVLDTNILIFGLRNQPDQPACTRVLQHLPRLHVQVPRQILLELQANLPEEERWNFRSSASINNWAASWEITCADLQDVQFVLTP